MQRWLMLGVLLVVLSGCSDSAHWMGRTVWGLDCRPEKLQGGACVAAR